MNETTNKMDIRRCFNDIKQYVFRRLDSSSYKLHDVNEELNSFLGISSKSEDAFKYEIRINKDNMLEISFVSETMIFNYGYLFKSKTPVESVEQYKDSNGDTRITIKTGDIQVSFVLIEATIFD